MTASVAHSNVLVVGAGSAGAIVAERLSSDSACTVTVLEAGVGLNDPALATQAADGRRLPIGRGSRLVRRYETALTDRPGEPVTIMRGATIGGSGAVNGGYFCRGLPVDFAAWPPGWSWPEVLGSFRDIETDLDFNGAQHGRTGPIPVRRSHEMCAGTERFIEAADRAGFGWIADLNDATQATRPGAGAVPLNIVEGVRAGPGAVYLAPALGRPNLTVLTETRAVRVEIEGNRARAVHAVGPDGPRRLTADRILLCAGAIESAHVLMLSGIGEEVMLRRAGIAVRAALPVGRHCSDHPEWLVAADWPATPGRPVLEAVLYDGDIEIRPYTAGFAALMGEVGPDLAPEIGVALMTPVARGRLTLVSGDPGVPLRIEHRYDTEPDDLVALRRGMELAGQLLGVKAQAGAPRWSTSQHLCGSAPMGPDDDRAAVLDAQCRVRGIEGLSVIDGSALPAIPRRGPHATIAMLAHRAGGFLCGQGRNR